MSEENVETLLSASRAARSGTTVDDREAFLTILDADVKWIAGEGAPGVQGTFRGIDEARNYYAGQFQLTQAGRDASAQIEAT